MPEERQIQMMKKKKSREEKRNVIISALCKPVNLDLFEFVKEGRGTMEIVMERS